jgi:hypothetical protein
MMVCTSKVGLFTISITNGRTSIRGVCFGMTQITIGRVLVGQLRETVNLLFLRK